MRHGTSVFETRWRRAAAVGQGGEHFRPGAHLCKLTESKSPWLFQSNASSSEFPKFRFGISLSSQGKRPSFLTVGWHTMTHLVVTAILYKCLFSY